MPSKFVSLIAIVSVFVGVANFLGIRDGSLTLNAPSFDPLVVDQDLFLEESVVQVIHTYLRETMVLDNVLEDGSPLPFVERVRKIYGPERINLENEVIDASSLLPIDQLDDLRAWVEIFAYKSSGPCPNDREGICKYYIGWNRELPAGVWNMSGFKLSDSEFLIVDQSVLRFE